MEEQVRGVLLEGDVADLVDDEEPVGAQSGELVGQAAGVVGVLQSGDPFGGGGEQDAVSRLGGLDPKPCGQVGDGARRRAGWWSKTKSSIVLVAPTPSGADPQPGAVGVTGADLPVQDGAEVLLVRSARVAGLIA